MEKPPAIEVLTPEQEMAISKIGRKVIRMSCKESNPDLLEILQATADATKVCALLALINFQAIRLDLVKIEAMPDDEFLQVLMELHDNVSPSPDDTSFVVVDGFNPHYAMNMDEVTKAKTLH